MYDYFLEDSVVASKSEDELEKVRLKSTLKIGYLVHSTVLSKTDANPITTVFCWT